MMNDSDIRRHIRKNDQGIIVYGLVIVRTLTLCTLSIDIIIVKSAKNSTRKFWIGVNRTNELNKGFSTKINKTVLFSLAYNTDKYTPCGS